MSEDDPKTWLSMSMSIPVDVDPNGDPEVVMMGALLGLREALGLDLLSTIRVATWWSDRLSHE